jgi:hypothetical protein
VRDQEAKQLVLWRRSTKSNNYSSIALNRDCMNELGLLELDSDSRILPRRPIPEQKTSDQANIANGEGFPASTPFPTSTLA